MLTAVVIVACVITSLPIVEEIFPIGYYDGVTEHDYNTETVYLAVLFVEEMALVLSVFQLRNVNDDFSMTKELTIICFLWILTGAMSTLDDTF